MRVVTLLMVFTVLLTGVAGCGKREQKTESVYTFTNTTGRSINFDVYGSREDYNYNTGRSSRYRIAPGISQAIAFGIAKTYWIDWYSDDFSFNNWRSVNNEKAAFDAPSPPSQITIAAEDDHYAIKTLVRDTSRAILLSGNAISSSWHGAITQGGSYNGVFRFEFRKDFSGRYSFTDDQGQTTSSDITYEVINNYSTLLDYEPGFRMIVHDTQPDDLCTIFSGPAGPFNAGKDTMTLSFSRLPFTQYWPVVRE